MPVSELLELNGIELESVSPGRHYTTCPQCSARRKPEHQKLKCLGVIIEDDRARWGCNHCGWTGPSGYGANRSRPPTYVYRDRDGNVRFGKVRNLNGRQPRFWLQHWDENAGWLKGTGGADTGILYRIDEAADAIEQGSVIAVVEGEKDADNMWRLGIPATCNAHGASEPDKTPKWTRRHSAQLTGADIVVFNDNDPSGYAHADAVCKLSRGVAKRVRRLDLKNDWPEIPKGGDVSDWLAIGGEHTAERLKRLIEGASEFAESASGAIIDDIERLQRAKTNELVVYDADAVEPMPIEWIWPGRIATGKTTLVGGDPGLGKSQFSIFVASTISQAGEWPCNEGKSPKRSIIILSAEDGVADTIVPRLLAAGADREKIKIVTAVHEENGTGRRIFNLTKDLDLLEDLIRRLGDVGLVIIDPVDAYIGGNVDSHKNAAVRAVLEPISEMADRLNVAILALTHLSKQLGGKVIYRFIGSIAHIGAARIAFAVVSDAEDKTRILLLHAKNNLAPAQKGLAFRIEQRVIANNIIGSSIFFEPEYVTGISADEALAAEGGAEQMTAKDEAKEFLLTILANGAVKIPDIEAEARRAGMLGEDQRMRQSKPFRSAKSDLHIISTREGFGSDAVYYWSLPEQAQNPDATGATIRAHHNNRAHMVSEGAHDEQGGDEGAQDVVRSIHVRPQTPCAPSFCEGAHADKSAHEGAQAGNGDDLTIPPLLDRRCEAQGTCVCAQCDAGRPDDQPTIEVIGNHGERLWVHQECLRFWKRENSQEKRGTAHADSAAKPSYEVIGWARPGSRCSHCGNGLGVYRIKYGGQENTWHLHCADRYVATLAVTPVKMLE